MFQNILTAQSRNKLRHSLTLPQSLETRTAESCTGKRSLKPHKRGALRRRGGKRWSHASLSKPFAFSRHVFFLRRKNAKPGPTTNPYSNTGRIHRALCWFPMSPNTNWGVQIRLRWRRPNTGVALHQMIAGDMGTDQPVTRTSCTRCGTPPARHQTKETGWNRIDQHRFTHRLRNPVFLFANLNWIEANLAPAETRI